MAGGDAAPDASGRRRAGADRLRRGPRVRPGLLVAGAAPGRGRAWAAWPRALSPRLPPRRGRAPGAGRAALAVRRGARRSRAGAVRVVLGRFGVAAGLAFFGPFTLLAALTLPLARLPVRSVRAGASGPALIKALGQTGRLQLAFGIAFAIGLAIHL